MPANTTYFTKVEETIFHFSKIFFILSILFFSSSNKTFFPHYNLVHTFVENYK